MARKQRTKKQPSTFPGAPTRQLRRAIRTIAELMDTAQTPRRRRLTEVDGIHYRN